MDTSEMKSLEEKTRAIIEALSSIEEEAKRQKDLADEIQKSREALEGLAGELQAAVGQISDVINLLKQSTLGEDVSLLESVQASCDEMQKGVKKLDKATAKQNKELSERLEGLEGTIGRIDRNTQKGLGKERG